TTPARPLFPSTTLFRSVERAAREGDLVALETWSQAGDERLPAEGAEKGTVIVGQGMMFEQIEKGLVGLAKGEERTLDVEFPADRSEEHTSELQSRENLV